MKRGDVEYSEIIREAWSAIEPELAAQGYELVEVDFTGTSHGSPALRVFVDKPGSGVTLDDCTEVSQLLGALLDKEDFIQQRYTLEVSSPGVDRPVRKPEDFARFVGEPIRLTTQLPTSGRKKFTGTLTGFSDGLIALDCDGSPFEVHIENVKRANLNR